MVSTALVFLMTPGLALFYGGMVRGKNVLSVLMQSFVAAGLVSVLWIVVGYSLAFGPDHGGVIGDFSWVGLNGVSIYHGDGHYVQTVPHMLFMLFQMTFAIITPALVSGAIVERMKFSAYFLFLDALVAAYLCPAGPHDLGLRRPARHDRPRPCPGLSPAGPLSKRPPESPPWLWR